MTVGSMYPPEWRDYLDPLTGRQVRQFTDSAAEKIHRHPHSSFTSDRRQAVRTSNRTGTSNIYLTDWN